MSWLTYLELEGAELVLGYVTNNATQIEADLQPYVKEGENDLVALAEKLNNPFVTEAAKLAVKYLGENLPKYEGSAVGWIEAALTALIAKLKAA